MGRLSAHSKTARGEKDSLPSWPSYGRTGTSISTAAQGSWDGRQPPFCWAFCCGCQHWGQDLEGTPLPLGLDRVLPLSSHTGITNSSWSPPDTWKGHRGDTGADHFTSACCGVWYLPSEHLALATVRNTTLWTQSCDIPVAPAGIISTSLLRTQIMNCPILG